ncbi:MAG: SMP-30/gluconolactonase/LRE family protein [Ardenticatenaceae bacterium]
MNVDIRDSRFSQVIAPGVELEEVVSGFEFTEGPIWHPYERHVTFSDIAGNTIYRWSGAGGALSLSKGGLSVFRTPSHMANGNTYDREGRMLTCEHATSRMTRTEEDGSVVVLASHYEGQELNSPNDIVVKSDGGIYFTDPTSGRSPYYGIPRPQELPFQGVYRFDPQDESLTLLVDDFSKPNGLCFSLDEKQLFVNDTDCQHIRVFDVQPDGTLSQGRVWAETTGPLPGVPDGMKVDQAGHLFCTGPGGIHLFDPHANCLGVILTPEKTANFAWGDDDLCSLYITASSSLYRLRVNVPGVALF